MTIDSGDAIAQADDTNGTRIDTSGDVSSRWAARMRRLVAVVALLAVCTVSGIRCLDTPGQVGWPIQRRRLRAAGSLPGTAVR